MDFTKNVHVEIVNNGGILSVNGVRHTPEKSKELRERIENLGLSTWQKEYSPEGFLVLDGYSWEAEYQEEGRGSFVTRGTNAFPWCFYQLISIIIDAAPESETSLKKYSRKIKCFY